MGKNLFTLVKILMSEQLALAALFYFEQVFVFFRLINKSVLEWFLLIVCKWPDLQIFLAETIRHCVFGLGGKVGRCPIPNRCFIKLTKAATGGVLKKSCSKNFRNITRKHLCWSFFFIKLQIFRPATLLKRDCNTGVLLLQNF